MKKLLAVDGNSILNRAFYGIKALSNSEGFYTNALYGLTNVLLREVSRLEPDYCLVAFDLNAPTFRHKYYSEYKAGRHETPPELKMQLPFARDCVKALGFKVAELEGYEADDILGTAAKLASESGVMAYVLTGDRDSLQLIGDNVHVLLATNTDTVEMDETAFFEKYGVKPSQFVDVKALMGDSSDHIPGVAGVGEKTALKLIAENQTLDGVYENIESLRGALHDKMVSGKESAYMSKYLARIICDVPLGMTLESLEYHGIDRKTAYPLFIKWGFNNVIKKLGLSGDDAATGDENSEALAEKKQISCAGLENTDLSKLCAISFLDGTLSVCDGEKYCSISDKESIIKTLDRRNFICFDCKTLYKELEKVGIKFRGCEFDVMLGAYVADSGIGKYDIERLVTDYLGETVSDSVPTAVYAYRLYLPIKEKLASGGQTDVLMNIEMPLASVLADMELRGFKVDTDGLKAFGKELDEVENELSERIYVYAGEKFNINSPKQLGAILFDDDKLALPYKKKTKNGYSTGAEVLEKLRNIHPIIEEILDYRQISKLKSTYVDGLLSSADDGGRVHTTFRQTGAATGRISSTEPNLQSIPVRTELGRRMREFFIPSEGYTLVDADYSQIELRLMAHISGDGKMINAFIDGADIHTSTAAEVFGVPREMVTPELRKRAKAVNFGIIYGIGEFSLGEDLGISRTQAKDYIEKYKASYPKISEYLDRVIKEAYENGYVTTMFGRRRYIPELSGSNKMLKAFGERVAMNSPIQGSAADIIKIAMINTARRLADEKIDAHIILQVHDELILEAANDCAEKTREILGEEMENAVNLSLPLIADAHCGKNWLECK